MFWKKKTEKNTNGKNSEADSQAQALTLLKSDPRDHHYVLGHIALRMASQSDPLGFFDLVASGRGEDLLAHLWQQISEEYGPAPQDIAITSASLQRCEVGEMPAVLAVLPPAVGVAEAMMAMVVITDGSASDDPLDSPLCRYFTLELGEDDLGKPATVFCEWQGDNHLNYGAGGEPSVEAFTQKVAAALAAY